MRAPSPGFGTLPVVVRRAVASDVAAIVRIDRVSRPEAWSMAAYASVLTRSADRTWVALDPGERAIVGVLCAALAGDEAEIYNVAIAPAARRRGVARTLLNVFWRDLAGDGVRRACLEVRSSNTAAMRLYAQAGWLVEGRRPGYYDHPREDAFVMVKEGQP